MKLKILRECNFSPALKTKIVLKNYLIKFSENNRILTN